MKSAKTKISFVIPCYRSEKIIRGVVGEIRATFQTRDEYEYEIILVNDCSPDRVYDDIQQLAKEDDNIHGISFSKNFGQHSALLAGMRKSTGDIIVCLDDDGQTPANEWISLVEALDDDTDVVYASYHNSQKKHSKYRNLGSLINEYMLRILLSKPKSLEITSFLAIKRFIVNEICRYENPFPYTAGLILQSTKKIRNVEVTHHPRLVGRSGYTFRKLVSLWLNGATAFSVVPLRIASAMGFAVSFLGFAYTLYLVIRKIVDPAVPIGYSSTMAAIMVIGGLLMLTLGMLGEYVGRIYMSINQNPQYVIRDETESNRQK